MENRNLKLDNVKWILTLLMVLYHIQYRSGKEALFLFIKNMGDCVVPAFALISGYLFFYSVKDFDDIKKKISRRLYTLLIPYVVWNVINKVLINILSVGLRNINKATFSINLYDDVFMGISSPHFWYIFMLIFWTVFSPILYFLYKYKIGRICLFASQVVYLCIMGNNVLHSRFIYILYTWGGLLGFMYPNLINDFELHIKKSFALMFAGIVYLGLAICIWKFSSIGMAAKVWFYAIRAVALIVFVYELPLEKVGELTNFDYSFWVFAVHFWLDHYVSVLIARKCGGFTYQSLTFLMVFVIAMSTGIICKKLFNKLFSILTGSRGLVQ